MTYPPQAIGLSVRLVDYDNVYIEGGDPRKRLPDGITNKEREIPANLVCELASSSAVKENCILLVDSCPSMTTFICLMPL